MEDESPAVGFSDVETTNSSESIEIDFPKRKLQKLNEFLQACKHGADGTMKAIGHPNKPWAELSQRRKTYILTVQLIQLSTS